MTNNAEESALSVAERIGAFAGRMLRWNERSPNAKLLGLLMFWVCIVLNAFNPLVRFGHPAWNYFFFSAAALTPLGMMVVACWPDGWRQLVVKFLIASLFIPAALLSVTAAGCGMEVRDGVDGSQERISSERFRGGKVAVYRTNGGATTSYGIIVRQECGIFPGISIIRGLTTMSPADEVMLEPLEDGSIRARFPAYGDKRQEATEIVRLRRSCWGPEV